MHPVSVLHCPHCEKVFFDVQTDPPVFQVVPVASDPVVAHHYTEPGSVLLAPSLQEFIHITEIPLSLLQAEQPQLSAFPLRRLLQSLHHLCVPLLDSLQYIHVSVYRRAQNQTRIPAVASSMLSRAKGPSLPWSADNTLSNAAQDTICPLFCKGNGGSCSAWCPLGRLNVFYCQAALQLGGLSTHCALAYSSPGARLLQFSLLNFMRLLSPLVQPVRVPLDGSTTLWHTSHSAQLGVIRKRVGGALCHSVRVINEDIEQDWSQY